MIGTELEDGSVVGRTLIGVLSGGIGCGNPKNKNIPKWWMRVSNDIPKLGQVSRMTGILEVERSLDSCTLAVHRPLAYFRSANVKTFCKIHNKSSFIRALNRLFRLVLQYILR